MITTTPAAIFPDGLFNAVIAQFLRDSENLPGTPAGLSTGVFRGISCTRITSRPGLFRAGAASGSLAGAGSLTGLPHFLQKKMPSPAFFVPQTVQVFVCRLRGTGGAAGTAGMTGEPHRSQNREVRSESVLPHALHIAGPVDSSASRRTPHL
jgi:hypothetical protein